jgi:hypothetical protein
LISCWSQVAAVVALAVPHLLAAVVAVAVVL